MAFRIPPVDAYDNELLANGRDINHEIHDNQANYRNGAVDYSPTDDKLHNTTPTNKDMYGYDANKLEAGDGVVADVPVKLSDTAEAAKLMRTSSWINTFFLITTDILGPTSAPYSIASMGYVPGVLLYFFCGVIAGYTGLVLLRLYMHYDSEEFPVRTYGDIADRVFSFYGRKAGFAARAFTAFFQALQLWLNVAVLILGNAQGLYQIATNQVCFLVLAVGFTAVGMVLGCIKQLRNISQLSNFCIWINLFIAYGTVGVAATTPVFTNYFNAAPSSLLQAGFVPYDPTTGDGLVAATGVAFNTLPLSALLGGLANMIYAYGGATIFVEFMAEMKRPQDFWKAFAISLFIIMGCYLSYGVALYSLQGPYVGNPGNQGITPYGWQTAFNSLNVFTGLVAAVLYGNVGMKVIYITICQEVFHAAPLTTRRGALYWYMLSVTFWWTAFILAEAIPQFSAFTGIVSAICIMQFSYTFPPLFQLVFEVQQDETMKEKLSRRWALKLFDLFLVLGSLSVVGLTLWGSIMTLISALQQPGAPTQFGCNGP